VVGAESVYQGRSQVTGAAIEMYWSQAQLALLFQKSPQAIANWIEQGRFGPMNDAEARAANLGRILKVDRSVMVPASRVRFFEARHSIERPAVDGVSARTEGELKRKLA